MPERASLTRRVTRVSLPVSLAAALLLAVAAPLTWYLFKARELDDRGARTAAQVAREMRRFVEEEPRLWVYNSPKVAEYVRARQDQPGTRIEVLDHRGRPVYTHPSGDSPFFWTRLPIEAAGGTAGTVRVGIPAAALLSTGLLLLAGFALLAALMAGLLYLLPRRALSRAEGRLARTLMRLREAQDELSRANRDLESRVERKTRSLRDAHALVEQQQAALRKLAAEVFSAQESERVRIARDLHDSVGQMLTAVRLNLETARRTVEPEAPGGGRLDRILEATADLVNETTETIRGAVHRMGVPLLRPGGLAAAVEGLARQFEHTRCPVEITRLDLGTRPLPHAVETSAFSVLQEAVTNAVRHGQARHIRLALHRTKERLHVEVGDDGRGSNGESAGMGLASMRDRIELLGGYLTIRTTPGAGTVVEAAVPLPPPRPPTTVEEPP